MNRVILIKYGELSTKKANRNFFIKTLYNNIENKLRGYQVKITKDLGRMYIYFNDNNLDEIINIMSNIFGIHTYHVAYIADTNIDDIENIIIESLKMEEFNTFKVVVKRSDKSFPYDSPAYSKRLGGVILKNINNISVDVHNPEITVTVEIRENKSYIYFNSYKGLGGYPVGTQPKGLLMLSGGIDSPVAGYLALKRGIKVNCVYFEAIPHTSMQAREKVIYLVKKLYLVVINVMVLIQKQNVLLV